VQTRDGRVWFITGASRGFGRQWATAALNRGDKVAAAFRTVRLAHEHSRSNVARRLALSLSDSVSDSLFHERMQMW
jgi:NAD(P)-dependent dehydrogenase (short-subunit alcohol dehydrogenase family)